ncbi:MAG: hypothetical protein ACP5G4_03055 [bacterium]
MRKFSIVALILLALVFSVLAVKTAEVETTTETTTETQAVTETPAEEAAPHAGCAHAKTTGCARSRAKATEKPHECSQAKAGEAHECSKAKVTDHECCGGDPAKADQCCKNKEAKAGTEHKCSRGSALGCGKGK